MNNFGNLFKFHFEITFAFKLKKNFTFDQIDNLILAIFSGILTVHLEEIVKFDFRPYSAFKFGSRNRKPNSENFRFRPKISASGIPLFCTHFWEVDHPLWDVWMEKKTQILIAHQKQRIDRTKKVRLEAKKSWARD